MKITLPYLLFLFPVTAMALGNRVGNGGDVVVCSQNKAIQSVELLDFYEARVFRGIDQDPALVKDTYEKTIATVLERLKRVGPQKTPWYVTQAQLFIENALFLPSGTHLVDISDSDHLGFPDHCKVEQIVVRKDPRFEEDKLYTIDSDLWNQLDAKNKAGVILHELLYRNNDDSIGARYINSILWSKPFETMPQDTFNKLYSRADFCGLETQGAYLNSCTNYGEFGGSMKLNEAGIVIEAYPKPGTYIIIQDQKIIMGGNFKLTFFDSGKPKYIPLEKTISLLAIDGVLRPFEAGYTVELAESGKVSCLYYRGTGRRLCYKPIP